jgi:hypothetical protein
MRPFLEQIEKNVGGQLKQAKNTLCIDVKRFSFSSTLRKSFFFKKTCSVCAREGRDIPSDLITRHLTSHAERVAGGNEGKGGCEKNFMENKNCENEGGKVG